MSDLSRFASRLLIASFLLILLPPPVSAEQETPLLNVDREKLVTLDFEDSTVAEVLDLLAEAGNLHYIFDEKVDLQSRTTFQLTETPVVEALGYFLRAHRLFYVVLESSTVLIAPDTREKRQEHTPMITRTFDLNHADGSNVITVLRSLLQARQLTHDESRNSITMTDSPMRLAVTGDIIDRIDRKDAPTGSELARDWSPLWVGPVFGQDLQGRQTSVPTLEADMSRSISMKSGDRSVREIYDTLGREAGVDFLFDSQVDLDRVVPLSLPTASIADLLRLTEKQLGHYSVVWGAKTVFVTADERARRRSERNEAIGFFSLAHVETGDVISALRSHLQSRQLVEITSLNAVLMRDGTEMLERAGSLVATLDVAGRPEQED